MLPLSGRLYITSGWTTIRELARPLNTRAFFGINPMAEPITSKLPATRPAPSLMKSECSSSCGRASLPASRADPDASGLSKCLYLNPGLQRANQKQLQDLDFSTEFESQSLTTASISYSACSTVSLGQFLPRLEPVFEVIPKHSAVLLVYFPGPSDDLVSVKSIDSFRTGSGYISRFGLMVHIDLRTHVRGPY